MLSCQKFFTHFVNKFVDFRNEHPFNRPIFIMLPFYKEIVYYGFNYLKMKKALIFVSFLLLLACAKENEEYECEQTATNRVGAMCKDGTKSSSTGQGTCSSHGGVDHWLCKD